MGDDLLDLPILGTRRLVGRTRRRERRKCSRACIGSAAYGGGRGAVRELVELVLRARLQWDGIVEEIT